MCRQLRASSSRNLAYGCGYWTRINTNACLLLAGSEVVVLVLASRSHTVKQLLPGLWVTACC